MDRILSTKNALLKHIQHTIFQAGIWTACTEAEPVIPSQDDFVWTEDELTNLWVPVWITITEVSKACK